MKQILCVRFRQWSIDLARRRRRSHRHEPLVLVATTASKQTVACASEKAAATGVQVGMTLAEARAMCPGLTWADYTAEKDGKSLAALARWMIRFSPVVAVAPPDGIFIDVTGSEKLFHGLDQLIGLIEAALQRYGFSFGIAVAPTPAAAWAIASFSQRNRQIIGEGELVRTVAPLPVESLRLEEPIVAALHLLGIQTVGQLQNLPRYLLPARFGLSILTRLDQLFGHLAEPLVAVQPFRQIRATLELEEPIESLEMLWEIFKRLIADVCRQLCTIGHGAKHLALRLSWRGGDPIEKEIHLSKPTCNASLLFNLLRCVGETLKSEEGFSHFSLAVVASQKLRMEQLHFQEDESLEAQESFEHLVERLRVRLLPEAVLFASLAESHLPEGACALSIESTAIGLLEEPERSRSGLFPRLKMEPGRGRPGSLEYRERGEIKSRPLRLLGEPQEVQCIAFPRDADDAIPHSFVYQGKQFAITHLRGPEKISGIWWEGRNKTREYFDVEETTGRRFWIFRVAENHRWFIHGFFDG